jgi:hypothetical protein
MILSSKTKEFIKAELDSEVAALGRKCKSKLKLIVRQGDPTSLQELEDICIDNAKGVLIMSEKENTGTQADLSCADFSVVKLVLKMASIDMDPECPIGVEADTETTADMIRQLKRDIVGLHNKGIQVFSRDKKLGQFLALTITSPKLSGIVNELLRYEGSEFYPSNETDIDELLRTAGSLIPVINMQGKTYVLAESRKDVTKRRLFGYETDRKLKPASTAVSKNKIKLYMIGENRKSEYMLETLKKERPDIQVFKYKTNDTVKFAQDLAKNGDKDTVALVLSDETVAESQYDANVFMMLIELSKHCDIKKRDFKIIAQILDPNNQKALEEFEVQNIIVSNRVISFFATKLLEDPRAEIFYEEIFCEGSNHAPSAKLLL